MSKAGRPFEKCVLAFVKAVAPDATVLFDHRVRDPDTQRMRQVDAWVEALLWNHIPLHILISCKDHRRPLDVGCIEQFSAEVKTTRANCGIMYSSSGFTKNALKKAEALAVHCCRLFRNEAADMPQHLVFWTYCCTSSLKMELTAPSQQVCSEHGLRLWKDLLAAEVGTNETVLDHICESFWKHEKLTSEAGRKSGTLLPDNWRREHTFRSTDNPSVVFTVSVEGRWKIYRAKQDAHLLDGSYCFSNHDFSGSITFPPIDTQGPNPGDLWELTHDTPATLPPPTVVCTLLHGDIKEGVRKHFADRPIF